MKMTRGLGIIIVMLCIPAAAALGGVELDSAFSTGMFSGTTDKPMEIFQFKFKNTGAEPVLKLSVEITGPALEKPRTGEIGEIAPGDAGFVKLVLPAMPEGGKGSESFHVRASTTDFERQWDVTIQRVPPDFKRIHLHTHFHYDPVWIHKDGQRGYALSAISLVKQYISQCRSDPSYTFVLEQIPYLKPFWDNYPEDREALKTLMARKQLEFVGGAYDQPDESSVFGEGLIRNFYYGRFFEEAVIGGHPTAAWQIDNFGHTPQFPQILVKSGMDSFTFLRGGPKGAPREFLWTAPDGSWIVAYDLGVKDDLGKALEGRVDGVKTSEISMDLIQKLEAEALPDLVAAIKRAVSSNAAFLPIGDDFMPPMPILSTLTRYWNSRYLYPAMKFSLPAAYFAEVRDFIANHPLGPRRTTKDLNPVFMGCYSSRTDIKIANRRAEMTYLDAEYAASIATLLGADYPARALDKALRELLYNDHHDSIPGTTNELSYLDILYAWRESLALSTDVRDRALQFIASQINTFGVEEPVAASARPMVIFNPLSFKRTDVVEITVNSPIGALTDVDGKRAQFDQVKEGKSYKLRFTAADVPALGYKVFYAYYIKKPHASEDTTAGIKSYVIENEFYKVEADPKRGGAIIHLIDKRSGTDYAGNAGGKLMNALFVQDDKGDLWDMRLSGGYSTTSASAEVKTLKGKIFSRITAKSNHPGFSIEQTITLQAGVPRVDFTTRVFNFKGQDKLFKLVFPVAGSQGLTPIYNERFTPLARKFGEEFPADQWAGFSSGLAFKSPSGTAAIGVPAVVVHADDDAGKRFVRTLIEAMIKVGTPSVTYFDEAQPDPTTNSAVYVGDPESFQGLKDRIGADFPAALQALEHTGMALLFIGDKPLWLISSKYFADENSTADMAKSIVETRTITVPAEAVVSSVPNISIKDLSAALINNGSNGYRFDHDGTIELQMLRSVTGRPGGEAYERAFSKEDWNHAFRYSFTAGDGGWEQAGVDESAQAVNRPLIAQWTDAHKGPLPGGSLSFFSLEPQGFFVSALRISDHGIPSYSRTGTPGGIMIRVFSNTSQPGSVTLGSYFPILSAAATDMQERNPKPIETDGREIRAEIGPRAIETYLLEIKSPQTQGKKIGRETEPVQPVYAAYWRHGDNVSPLGYQPVTVSFDPVSIGEVKEAEVKLKIASDYTDVKTSGTVDIKAPEGWKAEPNRVDYDLEPGGFKMISVKIIPRQDAKGGIVRAYYENEGQKFYASVYMGPNPLPAISVPAQVKIKPGQSAEVKIALKNSLPQEVSGEMVVISPIGTWKEAPDTLELDIDRFRTGFKIPASGSQEIKLKLAAAQTALPGSYWIVAKLMADGEYALSKPVEITILK